jgi:hypothetical protein
LLREWLLLNLCYRIRILNTFWINEIYLSQKI